MGARAGDVVGGGRLDTEVIEMFCSAGLFDEHQL
jgi:hypothetical protein